MKSSIEQGEINFSEGDGVATVEFSHPLSNSLPGHLLSELASTIEDAGENERIKVILLKSAGDRAFCGGASFDELLVIEDAEGGKEFFSGFAKVINAMRKCPKFIVGRVQGKAVGGGVGLASAVDYCLATVHASVKLSELAIGIGPFVVGPAVERKLGLSGMSELAINASEWRDAEWAHKRGLYNAIYDTTEELDKAIEELCHRLSNYNPEAMHLLKQVFWSGTDHWDVLLQERAEMSGKLVLSDFTRNAIEAFKNK